MASEDERMDGTSVDEGENDGVDAEDDVVVDMPVDQSHYDNTDASATDGDNDMPDNDNPLEPEEVVKQYADGVDEEMVGAGRSWEGEERDGMAAVEMGDEGLEQPTVTSTPKPGKDKRKSPPKTLKQRLGQIPTRLSKISIFNAIRSGTYVVNEPPPTIDDENNVPDADNHPADAAEPEQAKMTDNGVVANEDNAQMSLMKMQDEALQEPEVMSELASSPMKKLHSIHRSAVTKLLCGLYALLLVVFGIVFAVANALTVQERQHLYYLEVFLLYLYVGSLAILFYFQIGILRGKQVRNAYDSSIRVVIRRSQDNLQLSPTPGRRDQTLPQPPATPEVMEREPGLEPRKELMDQMSTLSNNSFPSHLVLPPDGQVAHIGEGINFYLRLGCLAFSIGSVTLDGFHIASYFETENTTTCESHIFTLVYVMHLIFTFVQTFFLFKNHKLVIDKNKASVRFGLMHLLAANLCVWFVTAVTETAEDYRQQDYFAGRNVSDPPAIKSCYEDMTLARTASPYLFPCTIIYSIIASGIVYRMYTYVGVKLRQRWPSHTSLTSSAAPQGVVSMDCEKANKGLFSGLLVAVVTLIAIATFFVFDSRLNYPDTAIKVFFIMEISLLVLTGGCILAGCFRFQQLRFLENYLSLDSVLLLVSLAGAFIYLCFMLISSASTVETHGVISVLSLVTIAVGLVQSTLQAIFILDGLCRRAENDIQVESKPGRAVVTFLLVCNLALWVVTLFEIRKTMVVPFHLSFYGILPWNIILHLCVPLFIYFRFHSAICLSKIWFNAYTKVADKMA